MADTDFHRTAASLPTANDGQLTSAERQRITRAKRERRKREGDAALATGRDEVVAGVAILAERELLRMPEVRERLTAVGPVLDLRTFTRADARPYLDQWQTLEAIARDYDRTLGDAPRLRRLLRNWDFTHPRKPFRYSVQWRVDAGCSAAGVGLRKGRPGTESSMSPEQIRLAVRSLALRPQARDELNRERRARERDRDRARRPLAGLAVEPLAERIPLGHEHGHATRARGATRADELAAADASAEGFKVNAAMVEKARRDYGRCSRNTGEVGLACKRTKGHQPRS